MPYTFWIAGAFRSWPAALLALLGRDRHLWHGTLWRHAHLYQGQHPAQRAGQDLIIIYVSAWLTSKGRRIRDARAGLLPFGVLMGIVAVLIVLQPEISTAILIVVTAAIMLFIAGADMKQLVVVGLITLGTFLAGHPTAPTPPTAGRYLASVGNPLASDEWQVSQGAGVDARRPSRARAWATGWRSRPAICPSVGATTSTA
jgi:cell division protein FtsW